MAIIDVTRFTKAVPQSEQDVKRFKFLMEEANDIRIAVFGKYNHGKSTLLNTIIGKDVFKTSDKRETVKNQTHQYQNVIWVDTPGLDADVTGQDDKEARNGAFTTADVLFLVHNLKSGELDKYEVNYYRSLMAQKKDYQKRMFLILTQADQVTPEQLNQVVSVIKKQLPELTTFVVSATRYAKGVIENKPPLVERSGMTALFNLVTSLSAEIKNLRKVEITTLKQRIQTGLERNRDLVRKELHAAREKIVLMQQQFSDDVSSFTTQVQSKI